jgi:CBS domain-containing protein
MRTQVYSIPLEATVREAAVRLARHGIESLVVADDDTLVGIVTERDLLQAALPQSSELMESTSFSNAGDLMEFARSHFSLPMSQVMRGNVVTTGPDVSLTRALGTMLARRLRRLPILDPATGKIAGVLTQRDIFSYLFVAAESSPAEASVTGH